MEIYCGIIANCVIYPMHLFLLFPLLFGTVLSLSKERSTERLNQMKSRHLFIIHIRINGVKASNGMCVPGALFIHLILIRANLMRLKLLPLFCSTEYSTSTTKSTTKFTDLVRTHQELQAKKYRYSVHHHGIMIFTQRHKTSASASACNNVLNGRLMLRKFFAI